MNQSTKDILFAAFLGAGLIFVGSQVLIMVTPSYYPSRKVSMGVRG